MCPGCSNAIPNCTCHEDDPEILKEIKEKQYA
jgi:hypothetical protein